MSSSKRRLVRHAIANADNKLAQALKIDGYSPLELNLNAWIRDELRASVDTALRAKKSVAFNGGRQYYKIAAVELSPAAWSALVTPAVHDALMASLHTRDVNVIDVSAIVVPPLATPQNAHRDHTLGEGRVVTLGLSLDDGRELGTLTLHGSHTTRGDPIDEHVKPTMARCAASALLFDAHLVHAGGANASDSADTHRVFISFAAAGDHRVGPYSNAVTMSAYSRVHVSLGQLLQRR